MSWRVAEGSDDCGVDECECEDCCDGFGTGDPCIDKGPCDEECPSSWCNPACGAGHGSCHSQCSGSQCNPGCGEHFDPCDDECEDVGFGPCSAACDERFCDPECEASLLPEDEPLEVCKGEEVEVCAPECPEVCDCDESGEWQWSGAAEFPNGNVGECVTVIFHNEGEAMLTATDGCCEGSVPFEVECCDECDPECEEFDPCDEACEDEGFGPCSEECDERFCNSQCDDYDECHANCNPECNPNCGGNPCDPACESLLGDDCDEESTIDVCCWEVAVGQFHCYLRCDDPDDVEDAWGCGGWRGVGGKKGKKLRDGYERTPPCPDVSVPLDGYCYPMVPGHPDLHTKKPHRCQGKQVADRGLCRDGGCFTNTLKTIHNCCFAYAYFGDNSNSAAYTALKQCVPDATPQYEELDLHGVNYEAPSWGNELDLSDCVDGGHDE